jgi:transmembrane sensor
MLRPALAFALAAVALVAVGMLWQGAAAPAFAAIANSGEAVRSVRLADGTVVWMDAGARIGVRIAPRQREVAIEAGRVRFVPAADPRPLQVNAGATRIYPGTTRIDVSAVGEGITVAALDGAVDLVAPTRMGQPFPIQLASGRALHLDTEGVHTAAPDPTWPAARVRFANAPLSTILALANRFGDPDLVTRDPTIAALRVSGVLDLRDTRKLARKLAATLELEVAEEQDGLVLQRTAS